MNHKALGNADFPKLRGYVFEQPPIKDAICEACGYHRGSKQHKAKKVTCSKIIQKRHALAP